MPRQLISSALVQVAVMEVVDHRPQMRFLKDDEVDGLVAEIESEKAAAEASRRGGQQAPPPT